MNKENWNHENLICKLPHCRCMQQSPCSNHHYSDECFSMPKESIEWEKECCCGKNGICKSLGDTLKLILEVHWEDREKLKELDNVIREHIASAVEAREREILNAIIDKCEKTKKEPLPTMIPSACKSMSHYRERCAGFLSGILVCRNIIRSIINPSKE